MFFKSDNDVCSVYGVPYYTDSLDAAMTLVQEGLRVWHYTHDDGRSTVWVRHRAADNPDWNDWGKLFATPALALCAAALRAQAGDPSDGR
ncbi:hypothetical protein HME9302_00034 [Alteripontixanthobacter maritimus]|nr:hypothetical protein HME9302_00034 [Alteripontixanthobacter maritimus]